VRGPDDNGASAFQNRSINVAFDAHAVVKVEQGRIRAVVEEHGGEQRCERFANHPLRTIVRQTGAPIRRGPCLTAKASGASSCVSLRV